MLRMIYGALVSNEKRVEERHKDLMGRAAKSTEAEPSAAIPPAPRVPLGYVHKDNFYPTGLLAVASPIYSTPGVVASDWVPVYL